MTLRTLSARHARVVRLGRLSARRRTREAEGAFVIDGPKLLGEALSAGFDVPEVFVDVDRLDEGIVGVLDLAESAGAEVFGVEAGVLQRVTDPVHPQPVAATARYRPSGHGAVMSCRAVLALIGVSDPGNAGTLIRSAAAAGFDAVATTPGTVEMFGPKTLRASAGAAFHVPMVAFGSTEEALDAFRTASATTIATVLDGDVAYDAADMTGPVAVLIGNEAHGLDRDVADAADVRVHIPMEGPTESLNAAMAGTLVCFEVLRQRRAVLVAR